MIFHLSWSCHLSWSFHLSRVWGLHMEVPAMGLGDLLAGGLELRDLCLPVLGLGGIFRADLGLVISFCLLCWSLLYLSVCDDTDAALQTLRCWCWFISGHSMNVTVAQHWAACPARGLWCPPTHHMNNCCSSPELSVLSLALHPPCHFPWLWSVLLMLLSLLFSYSPFSVVDLVLLMMSQLLNFEFCKAKFVFMIILILQQV